MWLDIVILTKLFYKNQENKILSYLLPSFYAYYYASCRHADVIKKFNFRKPIILSGNLFKFCTLLLYYKSVVVPKRN